MISVLLALGRGVAELGHRSNPVVRLLQCVPVVGLFVCLVGLGWSVLRAASCFACLCAMHACMHPSMPIYAMLQVMLECIAAYVCMHACMNVRKYVMYVSNLLKCNAM